MLIITIVGSLLISVVSYNLYRIKRRNFNSIVKVITSNTNERKVDLKMNNKLKNEVDEIYEILKNRDASFYFKFQKVFPNFTKNLYNINSDLTDRELLILAQFFLQIKSKQIAANLSMPLKTFNATIFSIRNKLHISTTEDITGWVKILHF